MASTHLTVPEAVVHKDNPGEVEALQKGDVHCTWACKRSSSAELEGIRKIPHSKCLPSSVPVGEVPTAPTVPPLLLGNMALNREVHFRFQSGMIPKKRQALGPFEQDACHEVETPPRAFCETEDHGCQGSRALANNFQVQTRR